jgi:hypothetical protein
MSAYRSVLQNTLDTADIVRDQDVTPIKRSEEPWEFGAGERLVDLRSGAFAKASGVVSTRSTISASSFKWNWRSKTVKNT